MREHSMQVSSLVGSHDAVFTSTHGYAVLLFTIIRPLANKLIVWCRCGLHVPVCVDQKLKTTFRFYF